MTASLLKKSHKNLHQNKIVKYNSKSAATNITNVKLPVLTILFSTTKPTTVVRRMHIYIYISGVNLYKKKTKSFGTKDLKKARLPIQQVASSLLHVFTPSDCKQTFHQINKHNV